MAGKEKAPFNYNTVLKKLRQDGPGQVYLLHGEEDYLRDSFLAELKKLCLEEGTEAFNYHRLQGPALDIALLTQCTDAVPFMGERTFTEVRDYDINRNGSKDAEELKAYLAAVPPWATVVFLFSSGYALDNRLTAVKALKKTAEDIEFAQPSEAELQKWVIRRAEDLGKKLDPSTASYLIWVCGSRMNSLIPEILKIASYSDSDTITRKHIDAVAKKAPETTIFNLTNALGAGDYDTSARLLADLLADKDENPQGQIVMISEQFRRMYLAKIALENRLGDEFITSCVPELSGRSYPLQLLRQSCRKFSRERLARAVQFCAQCDYAMKDTGGEPESLLKELLLKLAMDRA